jgi:hypothetical protein
MQPQSAQDYKNLLTEVIKKQIVILGPDITLSKARNVKGLTVQNDGTVTEVSGSPQEVTQALIDQFVQLSGLIVKKTMEPLLLGTQTPAASSTPPVPVVQVPTPAENPLAQTSGATAAPMLTQAPTQQALQQPAPPSPQAPPPIETGSNPTQPLPTPAQPQPAMSSTPPPPATQATDAAKNPQT